MLRSRVTAELRLANVGTPLSGASTGWGDDGECVRALTCGDAGLRCHMRPRGLRVTTTAYRLDSTIRVDECPCITCGDSRPVGVVWH